MHVEVLALYLGHTVLYVSVIGIIIIVIIIAQNGMG